MGDSEERLRLALDATHLGVWDLDLTTDVPTRSLRHDQIWGYAELRPTWGLKVAMRHVPVEDHAAVHAAHARAAKTGVLEHENRMFTKGDRQSLARTLVELQGGNVQAYSQGPGKGAYFTVKLPLHQAPTDTEYNPLASDRLRRLCRYCLSHP